MTTLDRLLESFKVDPTGIAENLRRLPIEVPDWSREDFGSLFATLGLARGAEIGVERGAFSESLSRGNPHGTLLCVDPWQAYDGYREHVTQSKLDGFFQDTQARLAKYGCTFIRKFSVDAAKDVPDRSLDYVYLDGNHDLPHVIADLAAWTPKVRKGGIISGHDYQKRSKSQAYQCHVVEAITAWTQAYGIFPYFVVGRKDVVDGERRDRPRSFLWVNQR